MHLEQTLHLIHGRPPSGKNDHRTPRTTDKGENKKARPSTSGSAQGPSIHKPQRRPDWTEVTQPLINKRHGVWPHSSHHCQGISRMDWDVAHGVTQQRTGTRTIKVFSHCFFINVKKTLIQLLLTKEGQLTNNHFWSRQGPGSLQGRLASQINLTLFMRLLHDGCFCTNLPWSSSAHLQSTEYSRWLTSCEYKAKTLRQLPHRTPSATDRLILPYPWQRKACTDHDARLPKPRKQGRHKWRLHASGKQVRDFLITLKANNILKPALFQQHVSFDQYSFYTKRPFFAKKELSFANLSPAFRGAFLSQSFAEKKNTFAKLSRTTFEALQRSSFTKSFTRGFWSILVCLSAARRTRAGHLVGRTIKVAHVL